MARSVCWLMLLVTAVAEGKPPRNETKSVVVQLKWTHGFQFAGYYAALHRRFYSDAGLDVELREATPGVNAVVEVVSGQADFGIGLSNLLLERARGRPVKLLANIFQESAFALALRPGLSSVSADTLTGKRVMLDPAGAELVAYLARSGLDRDNYMVVPHTFQLADLLDGRVDAMSIYVTDDLFHIQQQSPGCVVVSPRTAGIDFYGDNLFTSEAFASEHPGIVETFVKASLAGWQYALAHEEEIVDLILSTYAQQRSREHLLFGAAHTRELIMPDLVEIGYVNPR